MIVISKGKGAHIIAGVTFDPGANAILPAQEKALRENKHFKAQVSCGNMEIMEDDKSTNPADKAELTGAAPTGDPILDEANGILSLNKKDATKVIKLSLNISALKKVSELSKDAAIITQAKQRIDELKESKE